MMKRIFILIYLLACKEEIKLKIEDLNKFYIYAPDSEVYSFFISSFDTFSYKFIKLEKLNDLNEISNLILILKKSDKNFLKFYKHINNDVGYREDIYRRGDFMIGIFGENEEDLKFKIYMNKFFIDSILKIRIFESAYKRAIYFGIDEEKKKIIENKYGISINVPIGWNFVSDTIKEILQMIKLNPRRTFLLFFSNDILNLDSNSILNLKENFSKDDSLFEIRISNRNFNRICIDGKFKNGFFKSCSGKYKNKFYFYDIKVFDTINGFEYILEIEGFLSKSLLNY
jgi:hypothetical protein